MLIAIEKKMAAGSSSPSLMERHAYPSNFQPNESQVQQGSAGPKGLLWGDAPAVQLCSLEIKQCYLPQRCCATEKLSMLDLNLEIQFGPI